MVFEVVILPFLFVSNPKFLPNQYLNLGLIMGKRNNKNRNNKKKQSNSAVVAADTPPPSASALEVNANTSAATPNFEALWVGEMYNCGHKQAKPVMFTADIMGRTLKIEPDQEDLEKYRLKFTYDAYVAASISLYIFQAGGQEDDTDPTTNPVHSFKKDVEQGMKQEFIQEVDRADLPLHKRGFTEVYNLEIKSKARATSFQLKDGRDIRVSQTTQALFENVNGKIQVRVTNQMVWVNGVINRCHDNTGIREALGIGKKDRVGCHLCLARDNPGILRPIGKIWLDHKVIKKGSNGTTVVYEGNYDGIAVAVKRILKEKHHVAADEEIQMLKKSGRHSNIVGFYGKEENDRFVFIALERCKCNLDDLISSWVDNSGEYKLKQDGFTDLKLWKPNTYQPLEPLLNLMRDIVRGLAYLHKLGITHGDLKPQSVLIQKDTSITAKISDFSKSSTGIGTSGEEPTLAGDLFSLGILLFYCITGGKHPFVDHENAYDERSITDKTKTNLSLLNKVPEARNLISSLLDLDPKSRPAAAEVYNHPLFWDPWTRLSFLRDVSDRVELQGPNSNLRNSLESVRKQVFSVQSAGTYRWDEDIDPRLIADSQQYRWYDTYKLRDLLRLIRNKLNHYFELEENLQTVLGEVPTGYEEYFRDKFPKLVMKVYNVLKRPCGQEVFFQRYYKQEQF